MSNDICCPVRAENYKVTRKNNKNFLSWSIFRVRCTGRVSSGVVCTVAELLGVVVHRVVLVVLPCRLMVQVVLLPLSRTTTLVAAAILNETQPIRKDNSRSHKLRVRNGAACYQPDKTKHLRKMSSTPNHGAWNTSKHSF